MPLEARPGIVIGGRYRLEAELGHGVTATVWRAIDERLGRPVAVKLLRDGDADPTATRRFEQEAHTAARLVHPNIVAVYDVGPSYLVMELVDGDSLATVLADGPLPIERAVAVAAEICDALAAAHRDGVVHRDIQPANILLTAAGAVKVCDFGIAATSSVVGTSGYMAPEQATGEPVDARTDLYALGCLLYTMLIGRPPFTGEHPVAVLHQHAHQPPEPPRGLRGDIPAGLDRLVVDLLAKDPVDRPATADEVRGRLTAATIPVIQQRYAVGAAGPTQALPAIAEPSTSDTRRSRPIALVLALAVATVIVVALIIALSLAARRPTTGPGPIATVTSAGATLVLIADAHPSQRG